MHSSPGKATVNQACRSQNEQKKTDRKSSVLIRQYNDIEPKTINIICIFWINKQNVGSEKKERCIKNAHL